MFLTSKFNQDLSNWEPYKLEYMGSILHETIAPIPYWFEYYNHDVDERTKFIKIFKLKKELTSGLISNNNQKTIIKL